MSGKHKGLRRSTKVVAKPKRAQKKASLAKSTADFAKLIENFGSLMTTFTNTAAALVSKIEAIAPTFNGSLPLPNAPAVGVPPKLILRLNRSVVQPALLPPLPEEEQPVDQLQQYEVDFDNIYDPRF